MIDGTAEARSAALPTGTLHYLEVGSADRPLVVVLHGFPDCPPTFAPFIDLLAERGYRVIAPWLRGYAPSPLRGPFSLRQLSEDVLSLADVIAPGQRFAVVGHDWGSVIGHAVAASGDARVSSLTALAVPHPLAFVRNAAASPAQWRRSWYMMFFQLPRLPSVVLARAGAGLLHRLWRTWSPELFGAPPDVIDCVLASLPAPLAYYRNVTRAPARSHDELEMMRDIGVPTLQIQGGRDGCIAPAMAYGQERFYGNVLHAEVAQDRGHFMQVEAPAWLAERVATWVGDTHTPA